MKNRLECWGEFHGLIPENQCGFRKGKSCADNLTNLLLSVEEAFLNNEEVYSVFLDVASAFPSVNSDILIEYLAKEVGCSKKFISFIKFITYENRIHTSVLHGNYRLMFKGLGQGRVSSPILYLFYTAPIAIGLPENVELSMFADDKSLHSKNKNVLTETIAVVGDRLRELGLELATEKTSFIHFNNKNILPGNSEILIGENYIKSSESVKFLGIIFDYKLSFQQQIKAVHKKCSLALNIVKFLCGTWWGSHPETLLTLYKSFVRSIIEYGSFVYFPKGKEGMKKIERIQYSAIRTALGYRKSTPVNILIAESKLPLLRDRAELLCKRYLSKVMSNSSTIVYKKALSFHNSTRKRRRKKNRILKKCITSVLLEINSIETHRRFNIYRFNYEIFQKNLPVDFEFGRSLQKSSNPDNIVTEFIERENALALFVDGSKMKEARSVGSACICPELQIEMSKSIQTKSSIYTAESIALLDAIKIAENNPNRKIFIFSDSQSVLQSLNKKHMEIRDSSIILTIRTRTLKILDKNRSIKFFWIPSHIGIAGNEEADRIAKAKTDLHPKDNVRIPFSDLYESYKKEAMKNSFRTVENLGKTKGVFFFQNYFNKKSKPWFFNKGLKREFITTMNRLRADHYNLGTSLAKIHVVDSPNCTCGFENQDIDHIVWNCTEYANQRNQLFEKIKKIKDLNIPCSVKQLISQPNTFICKNIFQFLRNSDLKI